MLAARPLKKTEPNLKEKEDLDFKLAWDSSLSIKSFNSNINAYTKIKSTPPNSNTGLSRPFHELSGLKFGSIVVTATSVNSKGGFKTQASPSRVSRGGLNGDLLVEF